MSNIIRYGGNAVLVLLLCASFGTAQLRAAEPGPGSRDEYADRLVRRAQEMKLHQDPYWHVLLHYKKGARGTRSLVDDPRFFFASNGKVDPESEMAATIRAFFRDHKKGTIHPTAKFTARYSWLSKKLDIDPGFLPYDGEKKFRDFLENLRPSRVILVFPAGYISSPASMFGHTLILIESENGKRLLARAVNYAAITDETFGPAFAFRGLFGLYRGYYSFLPYHRKIMEYSSTEMRDIWEYELNLDREETIRLVRHVVEMEDIYSDYYFIDENCSYNLLFLLEAARPGLNLTERFGFSVEPVDTLRAVIDEKLVSNTQYRPSLYSRITHLKGLLNRHEQKLVKNICTGKSGADEIENRGFTERKKIIICDLCSQYLQFLLVRGRIDTKEYRSRYLSVLRRRNEYGAGKDIPAAARPCAPETGHPPQKLFAGGGLRDSAFFTQLSYRITSHELMDDDRGFTENSQIVFGKISLRYYPSPEKAVLERLDFIDIISMPPSNRFSVNSCWKFKTGLEQEYAADGNEHLTGYMHGSTGVSASLAGFARVYGFAGVQLNIAGPYQNSLFFAPGAEAGIITTTGIWKNQLYCIYRYAPFEKEGVYICAGARERIRVMNNLSIIAEYRHLRAFGIRQHEFLSGLNLFF